MVSVGQMAFLDAPQKHPCVIFIHPRMIVIALIIIAWLRHLTIWLKERLNPTGAACSPMIRMPHQLSTEIQMSNDSIGAWW